MHFNLKSYKNRNSGSIIIYVSVLMYCIILCFLYILSMQCNEYKVLSHEISYSKKQLRLCDVEQLLLDNLYELLSSEKSKIVNNGDNKSINILTSLNGYIKKITLGENEYLSLIVKDNIVYIKHIKDNIVYNVTIYSIKMNKNKLLIRVMNEK